MKRRIRLKGENSYFDFWVTLEMKSLNGISRYEFNQKKEKLTEEIHKAMQVYSYPQDIKVIK